MNKNNSKNNISSKTDAGIAGAGGGTLVAVIANQFPDTNVAKSILQYASPSISILLSVLWIWLQVKIANYIRDIEVARLINKTRKKLRERIEDNNISEEHRHKLRKELENLDSIDINRFKSKIKELTIITEEDINKIKK